MEEAKTHEFTVIINGRPRTVSQHTLSYRQLVELAFGQYDTNPDTVYTVTYFEGKSHVKGSLVDGEEVEVREGMIFNVTRTDKS